MDTEPVTIGAKVKEVPVKSFRTQQGTYQYDNQGKVARTDAVGKEVVGKRDITIFVNLDESEKTKILEAKEKEKILKVCILERQEDDSGIEIRQREDIKDEENIYLGIIDIKSGKKVFTKKASLVPTVGDNVFEGKTFQENGKNVFKTNLGSKVTEIDTVPSENKERKTAAKSFVTAKGSVYTYDDEGRTTRFKTATGEQHERQDVTVFINLSPDEEQLVLNSYRHIKDEYKPFKIYICEKSSDGTYRRVNKREEIKNPERIHLVINNKQTNEIVFSRKVSLEPTVGLDVFDMRHFQEDGNDLAERHLGNKVVKINY